MLRILGQGEYGLYELSYAFISYLNLLSFGFNSAYLRFYARLRAVEGEQASASLNGMFLTVFACLAGCAPCWAPSSRQTPAPCSAHSSPGQSLRACAGSWPSWCSTCASRSFPACWNASHRA